MLPENQKPALFIGKDLASKLEKRFNLRREASLKGSKLLPDVQPITVVDDIVSNYQYYTGSSISISGGSVYMPLFTVPSGKKWRLLAAKASALDGTFTMSFMAVGPNSSGPVEIKSQTPSANIYLYPSDIPGGIKMTAGWSLYAFIAAYSVAGHMLGYALIEEEDAQ